MSLVAYDSLLQERPRARRYLSLPLTSAPRQLAVLTQQKPLITHKTKELSRAFVVSGSAGIMQRVDWEGLWSCEAHKKQLPSLHGIVSRYTKEPDVIGMHGGLPPSNTFPFTWFQSGLLPLPSDTTTGFAADNTSTASAHATVMKVDDPQLVSAAQQYNMHAQGYAPLVSWARDMVISLHKPATLQPHPQPQAPDTPTHSTTSPSQQQYEPVGMDVVVTPGASAALDSLVRVLVNPGDAVLVEEYTYAHMAEAHLLPLGCELLPVSLDQYGLVPTHLDALLTARQAAGLAMPKLLYTIPTGQNPTGAVMTPERMADIYGLARKWSLIIIEDDAYYWLQYPHGPDNVPGLNLRPGFLNLDVDGRVVRVDTLAKLLGPGFRLGWLSGPPALVAKLALYMAGISIGANMVSQVMLHELLAKTWGRAGFEAFVKRLQAQYARQAAVAAAAAEQQLVGLAEWQPVRAGMFMWFKLTGDLDSESLIEAAAASKVMVVPGHLISVTHLQAAHRRKAAALHTAQQAQQHEQQGCHQLPDAEEVVSQLQDVTQQLQRQQEQQGAAGVARDGPCGDGLASIAAQLAIITQQLQQLQQLGNSSSTHLSAQAAQAANSSSSIPHAAGFSQQDHIPCPFFRVSFVSVPAEAIEEGFVRLRAAILSCHGPKTPPGEESEISSCSSSIGSSVISSVPSHISSVPSHISNVPSDDNNTVGGGGLPAAVAAAASADSAMC